MAFELRDILKSGVGLIRPGRVQRKCADTQMLKGLGGLEGLYPVILRCWEHKYKFVDLQLTHDASERTRVGGG